MALQSCAIVGEVTTSISSVEAAKKSGRWKPRLTRCAVLMGPPLPLDALYQKEGPEVAAVTAPKRLAFSSPTASIRG